jgi:hypothetical protein
MHGLARGFWDILDDILRSLGKFAASMVKRAVSGEENCAAHAMIGGALVCAVFGGAIGILLSDLSRSVTAIDAAIIGGLLGICMGIYFGAFVDTVDGAIQHLLRSLSPK